MFPEDMYSNPSAVPGVIDGMSSYVGDAYVGEEYGYYVGEPDFSNYDFLSADSFIGQTNYEKLMAEKGTFDITFTVTNTKPADPGTTLTVAFYFQYGTGLNQSRTGVLKSGTFTGIGDSVANRLTGNINGKDIVEIQGYIADNPSVLRNIRIQCDASATALDCFGRDVLALRIEPFLSVNPITHEFTPQTYITEDTFQTGLVNIPMNIVLSGQSAIQLWAPSNATAAVTTYTLTFSKTVNFAALAAKKFNAAPRAAARRPQAPMMQNRQVINLPVALPAARPTASVRGVLPAKPPVPRSLK